MEHQKLRGDERRAHLLRILEQAHHPLTGTALAEQTGVSRQVIVQDIALLKAKDEPILATPQGYVYFRPPDTQKKKRIIACQHLPEETETELNTLVDHGVSVIDVSVEHPLYGQIQGSLMLHSRSDVQTFLRKWENSDAQLLSTLTAGVHLHTIEGDTEQQLDQACQALAEEGILLDGSQD
jgi:uncharacterized protein